MRKRNFLFLLSGKEGKAKFSWTVKSFLSDIQVKAILSHLWYFPIEKKVILSKMAYLFRQWQNKKVLAKVKDNGGVYERILGRGLGV